MLSNLRHRQTWLNIVAFGSGWAVPLSTGLQNITLPLIAALVLAIPDLRHNLARAWREPLIKASIVFYALFLSGCMWSLASLYEMSKMLLKMLPWLELPLLVAFYLIPQHRRYSGYGFSCGIGLTLVFSYISIIFDYPMFHAKTWGIHYGIFRAHAYHSYFLALFASWCLYCLLHNHLTSLKQKLGALLLIGLCYHNIFFETFTRTGQILSVLMFIIILLLWQLRWGAILSAVIVVVIVPALIYLSPTVRAKITAYQHNQVQFAKHQFDPHNPSMYARWTYHNYAWEMIRHKPLFGYGTGSYQHQYAVTAKAHHDAIFYENAQPHSDYLWFGVELGYSGMLAFIAFMLYGLIRSWKLPLPYRDFAVLLFVSYALSCLENSFITDSVSGLAFFLFVAILFANSRQVQEVNYEN